MAAAPALFVLACLATLLAAAPADQQAVDIVPSVSYEVPSEPEDSYRRAANAPQQAPLAPHDDGAPDHALAPPPADHVSPVARHLVVVMPGQEQPEEYVREKRQFGYGGYGGGYGRRGYGRRRHGYGGYGGRGGYGGYGGYPGGYGGYGGYPGGFGGGFGGSGASSQASSSSFSGGFGPFQFSASQANSNAGSVGFGR